MLRCATALAIPNNIHQKHSETYGGRNSHTKSIKDASDLKSAVDSNLDAMIEALLAEGFTHEQIEAARQNLHQLNQEQGWY